MTDLRKKKVVVTGGAGFLGSFVVEKLLARGVPKKNIFIPHAHDCDLRKWENCKKVARRGEIIIHLAAKVGGIGYNREKPGELFYDNIIMGVQMMEAARLARAEKFVAIGTICAYPKYAKVPFKEDSLWDGYPEETNAPYGIAKKALLVQSQSYRDQYGLNSIYLLPVNLYGPRDNFDPKSSHVIPALIKKIKEAKDLNKSFVEVWGSGRATREFLYVEDAAEAIVLAAEKYNKREPVNLGTGREISIDDLAKLIKELLGYKGRLSWNSARPDGQPRRAVDTSRAHKEFEFRAKTSLEKGLRKTIDFYAIHVANKKVF